MREKKLQQYLYYFPMDDSMYFIYYIFLKNLKLALHNKKHMKADEGIIENLLLLGNKIRNLKI